VHICTVLFVVFQVNLIVFTVWLMAFSFSVAPLFGWNKYIAEVSEQLSVLEHQVKETVSRDFRQSIFFTNQPHLGPDKQVMTA
jgi:hypothetical protein